MGVAAFLSCVLRWGDAQAATIFSKAPIFLRNFDISEPQSRDLGTYGGDQVGISPTADPNTQQVVPNTQHCVPNPQHCGPNTQQVMPNTQEVVPNTQHCGPNTQLPVPNTRQVVPNSQHFMPNTQISKPNTRNPVPKLSTVWSNFSKKNEGLGIDLGGSESVYFAHSDPNPPCSSLHMRGSHSVGPTFWRLRRIPQGASRCASLCVNRCLSSEEFG